MFFPIPPLRSCRLSRTPKWSVVASLSPDSDGGAFISDAKLEDVLAVVRDYSHYKEFYKHTVVDSKPLSSTGACDRYLMLLANKEVVATTALDGEYEACYYQVDERAGTASSPPRGCRKFGTTASLMRRSFHLVKAMATSGAFTVLPGSRREMVVSTSSWKRLSLAGTSRLRFGGSSIPLCAGSRRTQC
jgi:hypothetical protein